MVGILELDDKDKKILEILEKNPEISQNEIAKVVGLSQPSVGSRIKKMKELGIINHAYGINIKNAGLYILKADIKCRQPKEILKLFDGCPFFLNGFVVAGNKNLSMLFIGEDLSSLEAIVDQHIRTNPHVYDVDVGIIVRAENDTIVPMKMHVERAEKPPCKSNCGKCDYWEYELCLGCPITGHYRGKIWR
ncbi:Lrp/AsnC family transcriptional regulator [Archaeoglobales archaeon]|nr:MAG: Lrp/AsnC family transcriptional regulator [Archaeoglobales archaeon]